jgi:uncharacterized membrane protein
MLYAVAIVAHVVVAVLAVGLVGAIPIMARWARRTEAPGTDVVLATLLRAVQIGFGLMLVTGVLLDLSVDGAFHRTGWFKVSMGLLVVVGVSLGRTRASLRRAVAPGGQRDVDLGRVERWGWVMCAGVALVTVLMQSKLLP